MLRFLLYQFLIVAPLGVVIVAGQAHAVCRYSRDAWPYLCQFEWLTRLNPLLTLALSVLVPAAFVVLYGRETLRSNPPSRRTVFGLVLSLGTLVFAVVCLTTAAGAIGLD